MHRPFRVLENWVRQGRLRLSRQMETDRDEPVPRKILDRAAELSDGELFEAAVEGVSRRAWSESPARVSEPLEIRPSDDEAEALEALGEFCRSGRLETYETGEYVEHSVDPAGRLYLDDLRSGRFAIQAHLDLHGMNVDEARSSVDVFVKKAVMEGYSCVRVVHGRGRHSPGARPIIKEHLERWLRHRRLARFVIAYTSARTVDGGGGAVYVLLRRPQKRSTPPTVPRMLS